VRGSAVLTKIARRMRGFRKDAYAGDVLTTVTGSPTVVGTTAIDRQTVSVWRLNAAFLANPIVLVVAGARPCEISSISLRTASGGLHAGANVENASYGLTLCAESAAIAAMVTAGDREIVEVVILTEGAELCPPCGRCRQQLKEFAAAATRVHLCGPEGVRLSTTLGELLPLAFGPDAFGTPPR